MDYQETIAIIRAALDQQESAYAFQTAERWLQEQPGHLAMSILQAEALIHQQEYPRASRVLDDILEVDPENEAALLLKIRLHAIDGDAKGAWAAAATLRQVDPGNKIAQSTLSKLAGDQPAGRESKRVHLEGVYLLEVIPSLSELHRRWRAGDFEWASKRARQMLIVYPRLAKVHLIAADALMNLGEEVKAVAHLHQAAALDPGGGVARRLWNGAQPYAGAWPSAQALGSLGPLPHSVASALGLHLLAGTAPGGQFKPSNGKSKPFSPSEDTNPKQRSPLTPVQETLVGIQTEINRLLGRQRPTAVLKPNPARSQQEHIRLQPIYAIISSKAGLIAKYGQDGWEQINGGIQALARAAETRMRTAAGVIYVDDAESLDSFGLSPVDPSNPWEVKALLDRLDARLEEQRRGVGWVLLVGGPQIIPFHRLPNPAEDQDPDVPSDNPYGSRDENYFLPQRAVGRIPDADGDDPTLLLRGLATALAAHHAARRSESGWLSGWWERLMWLLRGKRPTVETSFGYTASVWRRASLAVFSKIGSARRLRISPPLTAAEFNGLSLGPARYGYFNLHGIADGPAWYGQRDPTFPADYPHFPVALRPEDVGAWGATPEVVFTEACYGALIENKKPQTSLALKFLASGTQMLVGSSCIAYGGINSSLEAADLLALLFWQELMSGRSGGGALQQAKLSFACRLDERHGYLDGEDQKTLISFSYYGDPTLPALPSSFVARTHRKAKQHWHELTECPPTICARGATVERVEVVPEEVLNQVRERVSRYLPGMEHAQMAVKRQRPCLGKDCQNQCANCHPGAKGFVSIGGKMVFSLSKTIQVDGEHHHQLVRATVDDEGQLLKLAVSK